MNENASSDGTERAAVENKPNARPNEDLASPVVAFEQTSIAKCPPLKTNAPPPRRRPPRPPRPPPPPTIVQRKREQHQPDSSSGSGLVNANSADQGPTPTVATSALKRPPGLYNATASSSVTIQAAFDDADKSGAGDAGGDGAGSSNSGDGATTPTGSSGAGMAVDIGATGTPELDRMERGESVLVAGRSRDTPLAQSEVEASPQQSDGPRPSGVKSPVAGSTASAQHGVTSKNTTVHNAGSLDDEEDRPLLALVSIEATKDESGLGSNPKDDQAEPFDGNSPSNLAATLQESTGHEVLHGGLAQGPFSTTSENSSTESATEDNRHIPVVDGSYSAKDDETPIRNPPPLEDQHSSSDLAIDAEVIQMADHASANQTFHETTHGGKAGLDAGKIDTNFDTDTAVPQEMTTSDSATQGINFNCDSGDGLGQANVTEEL